jgi:hypothetical protein
VDVPTQTRDSLLTKDYLDLTLTRFERDVLREFRRQMVRLAVWITVAAIAASALSAGFGAILA